MKLFSIQFIIEKTSPKPFRPSSFFFSVFSVFLGFLSVSLLLQFSHTLNASEVGEAHNKVPDKVPNQIIVKYKDPSFSPLVTNPTSDSTSVTEANASDGSQNNKYKYTAILPGRKDYVLIEGENVDELLEELKKDPNVEYAEPNYIKQFHTISLERSDLPNDSDFYKQWALKSFSSEPGSDIDFLEALALSRESNPDNPVIIGIIDSTFAIEHPDLINQLWVNEEEIPYNGIDDDNNGYIDDIHGFDFVNYSPNVKGDDHHGSHVAGIAAAEKNNQRGISGVFPNVKFIALACSAPGGDGISSLATFQAKNYLINLKNRGYNIVAVNASYGSNNYSQMAYDSIRDLFNNDILFCTGAGNDGWNLDLEKDHNGNGILDADEDLNGNGILEVAYPNSYNLPNIISVASTNWYRGLALHSNYGHTEVDIAAPGEAIYSTTNFDIILETQDIILSNGTKIKCQIIKNTSHIVNQSIVGSVLDCGYGNEADIANGITDNIALIKRNWQPGEDSKKLLYLQIVHAQKKGAKAVIIYNNKEESPDGLRNWETHKVPAVELIPAISISEADGNELLQSLPLTATLKPFIKTIDPTSIQYGYLSGTSMASPIVTAAVAFAAHNFPNETMAQRRARVLNSTVTLSSLNNKVATGGVVNLRKIVDTDEDNLPDWWEMDHFNTLANTNTQDSDNDGYSNRDEFLSKTDPSNANDRPYFKTDLKVSNLTLTNSDALSFEFMTHPGYKYTIQSMDSLSKNTWIDTTQSNLTGDGIPMKVTIDDLASSPEDTQFFRLQATPK